MKTERKIDMVKNILLWLYLAIISFGIFYSAYTDQIPRKPAEIIYERARGLHSK